jgi:hypothetical protein
MALLLLFAERYLDNADNNHQYAATDTTAGNTPNNAADVRTARTRTQAQLPEQLTAKPAAYNAGNRITDAAQGLLRH